MVSILLSLLMEDSLTHTSVFSQTSPVTKKTQKLKLEINENHINFPVCLLFLSPFCAFSSTLHALLSFHYHAYLTES